MDGVDELITEEIGAVPGDEVSQQRTIAETVSDVGELEVMNDGIGAAETGNGEVAVDEDDDDEDADNGDEPSTTSPIMLSSFVANSALPNSLLAHRVYHKSPTAHSDSLGIEKDWESDSSAAQQLVSERLTHTRRYDSDDESDGSRRPFAKRQRTESRARSGDRRKRDRAPAPKDYTESSPDPLAENSRPVHAHLDGSDAQDIDTEPTARQDEVPESEDEEDADEYAVESILAHSHQGGVEYYLVKWEGYEEVTDWLPESALEGAAEMVAEYNARVRPKKKKRSVR